MHDNITFTWWFTCFTFENKYFCMVSIIFKSSFLSGQCAGASSVFLQIKTLVEIERPSCYANESHYYFKWNLSKDSSIRKQRAWLLSSQLIVLLILRNSHQQSRKFTKKCPWWSLILVKLQVFTGAATWVVL